MFISFQILMSVLKILIAAVKGEQLVQIPKDRSLALVILDSMGMDTTAQVIQIKYIYIYTTWPSCFLSNDLILPKKA